MSVTPFLGVSVNRIQRHIANSNEALVSIQHVSTGFILLFVGRGFGCRKSQRTVHRADPLWVV